MAAASPTAEQECHHRIANSLQLLMASVSAESKSLTDPAALAAMDRLMGRIGAIAGLHRHLTAHENEEAGVDLAEYLVTLAKQIEAGCSADMSGHSIVVSVDTVRICAQVASAIGMIVSECMINAVKYAYPSGHSGEIRLSGRIALRGVLGLCVEDDGCGIGNRKASSGLGMDLLKTMAARIGGVMHWQDARPGTRILLAVPLG